MGVSQTQKLKKYVDDIKGNPHKSWEVAIGNMVNKGDYYATASYSELSKMLGISTGALQGRTSASEEYISIMKDLNDILKHEGVLLKKETSSALELRRVSLLWWRGLSLEDKKNLSMFGNSIRFKKYIPNWRGGKNYEIISKLATEFNNELVELGILKSDYLPVKDRDVLFDKTFIARQAESANRWEELASKPIRSYDEFVAPDSSEEPFVQLKQLAAIVQKGYSNKSSKNNIREAYNHLCKFLEQNSVETTLALQDILSEFILTRFKHDYILPLLDSGAMAPQTAPTLISATRKILKRAKALNDLDFYSYYDVEMKVEGRVTDSYKPYSTQERIDIHDAIQGDINGTLSLLSPYVKTGVGENPLNEIGQLTPGKSTLDNAHFLFENYLNCMPVYFNSSDTPQEKGFLSIVGKHDIGLHDLYKQWGVLSLVDYDVLAPFLFRLAQVTGMNSDPLSDLKLDDFTLKHQVTCKPCLRYWKERSTGEKELHLDLFDAKLQWLTQKQSVEVKKIFDDVIKLTSSFREEAPESIRNNLFIFKSSGKRTYNEIKSISEMKGKTTGVYSNFVERHSLKGTNDAPLIFSVSRFRPTFVSEMVEAGVSIREIQLMLGHSNIETTMNYLDRLDFNRISRAKLDDALKQIHNRIIIPPSNEKKSNKHEKNPDRIIFSTPLGGCANIFSPPDFIKNSSIYKKGQPCSQYNKCLACENIMITVDKLPMLFAMRRDYMLLMQRNRIMETPYGIVIEENLSLLDEILNPKKSDFCEKDLKQAERLSLYEETAIVDGVTA